MNSLDNYTHCPDFRKRKLAEKKLLKVRVFLIEYYTEDDSGSIPISISNVH